MKILSSFTHPHDALNSYDFLSYVEHRYLDIKNVEFQTTLDPIDLHCMEKSIFSKYPLLCLKCDHITKCLAS